MTSALGSPRTTPTTPRGPSKAGAASSNGDGLGNAGFGSPPSKRPAPYSNGSPKSPLGHTGAASSSFRCASPQPTKRSGPNFVSPQPTRTLGPHGTPRSNPGVPRSIPSRVPEGIRFIDKDRTPLHVSDGSKSLGDILDTIGGRDYSLSLHINGQRYSHEELVEAEEKGLLDFSNLFQKSSDIQVTCRGVNLTLKAGVLFRDELGGLVYTSKEGDHLSDTCPQYSSFIIGGRQFGRDKIAEAVSNARESGKIDRELQGRFLRTNNGIGTDNGVITVLGYSTWSLV